MSPVFRHGGLRLYLLKLLDEAPRHGYDVIRLLQDRFLGVYSPSPGTIYPRLARLEEEGLVTHETVDGKKIYKITDAGRAELSRRLDDLADLEDELAASVRDIAREISRDVRETVRNLRDELTFAVREANRTGEQAGKAGAASRAGSANQADAADRSADPAQTDPVRADSARADAARADAADRAGDPDRAGAAGRADATGRAGDPDLAGATDGAAKTDRSAWATSTAEFDAREAQAEGADRPVEDARAEDARTEDARPDGAQPEDKRSEDGQPDGSRPRAEGSTDPGDGTDEGPQDRRRSDWRDWAERGDWREWADWAKRQPWGDWADWTGKQDWKERAKAGRTDWSERAQSNWGAQSGWAQSGRQDWIRGSGPKDRDDRRDPGPDLVSDLEHLAAAFAREIRGVARQAENAGEDAVGSLGRILGDTLNRIRTEVFKPKDPPAGPSPEDAPPASPRAGDTSAAPDAPPSPASSTGPNQAS
jgi:DNA-binding PadR family transcriptional regulator